MVKEIAKSLFVLKLKVDAVTDSQFRDFIKNSLKSDKQMRVVKINTEFLQRALQDDNYAKVLNSFDLHIADGRGVQWAARYLTMPMCKNRFWRPIQAVYQMIYSGASIVLRPSFIRYPLPEVLPGVEAFGSVMDIANQENVGVFLFGSPQATLDLASKNIKKEYPSLKIAGMLNGYDFWSDDSIDPVKIIDNSKAAILPVAMGSPKQEYWINDNLHKMPKVKFAVGEGGTYTRIAFPSQKSPKWVNRIGCEWIWRLFFNKSETASRNRFQRFWNAVPLFIFQAVKWKIKHGPAKVEE